MNNYLMRLMEIVKIFVRGFLFAFFYFVQIKVHAFEVDFSRRIPASEQTYIIQETTKNQITQQLIESEKTLGNERREPAFVGRENDAEILKALKKAALPAEPTHEIVILNTETGFIPEKVQVKRGEVYQVHVVNLNLKEKNVSFLMDSFTQSHNTVYGQKKTFKIDPQVEGIYSYQCPETGIQGQMIVIKEHDPKRKVSSVEEKEQE